MVQIQIQGMRKVNYFLQNLPRNMNREINDESGSFLKDVRKSAKLRAPRDTGELANSIKITKSKNTWILSVEAPYSLAQEKGFKPHWIHSSMIKGSNKLIREGFFFVQKNKPFVQPALEKNLSKLSQRMSKATNNAINKSRGGR